MSRRSSTEVEEYDPLARWEFQDIRLDERTDEELAEAFGVTIAEMRERQRFIEKIGVGVDPLLAGLEVGWSIMKTRRITAEMRELVDAARNIGELRIGQVVIDLAHRGVEWAVKLVMFNRRPDLYKDVRHIEVKHSDAQPAHVLRALREEMRAVVVEAARSGAVAQLQAPIIDAEVIEDGDAPGEGEAPRT